MTVFVTGGAGYIGSHTCVELLNRGYEVIVADDLVNSSVESLRRVEKITGKAVTFYETDIRDKEALAGIFKKHRIDACIHFAGLKAVGESVAMPLEYYDNNLQATISLLETMREFGVKRIIFSSSATVYSRTDVSPLTEDSPTGNCTNPYGWTKYMSEQILRDYAKTDPGISVVLLRYFNPIGAHASGMIGENPSGIPNNLMPYITQVAVGKREMLSVYGSDYDTPDGTGVRDYIHVVDLARGHVAAVDYMLENAGAEVFNLGTGRGCSVLELVEAFERVNGVKIPYRITGRRPGDLATVFAATDKSEKLLHWKAEYGIDEMCRDSWNWQKNNPDGYPRE